MHARQEQHLGFVDVADAGDDALIEQRRRDRAMAARDDAADRFVAIERLAQQIGPELRHRIARRRVASA
jgi:hypothetical protein